MRFKLLIVLSEDPFFLLFILLQLLTFWTWSCIRYSETFSQVQLFMQPDLLPWMIGFKQRLKAIMFLVMLRYVFKYWSMDYRKRGDRKLIYMCLLIFWGFYLSRIYDRGNSLNQFNIYFVRIYFFFLAFESVHFVVIRFACSVWAGGHQQLYEVKIVKQFTFQIINSPLMLWAIWVRKLIGVLKPIWRLVTWILIRLA